MITPIARTFALFMPILVTWMAALPTSASARDYQIETVAEGLEWPWSLAFLPEGDLLVTERGGALRLIENGQLRDAPIDGVPPVYANSQGGLFEALPDPDFAANRWIYLSYAYGSPNANATRVARARLIDGQLVDLEVLFTASPTKDTPVHYGGRMTWLADGTLAIGLGDGFDYREQAQRLDNHIGSIVRIRPDGSVPEDNPFVDRDDALDEIWSYGHRNVQGLAWDERSGVLWQHEHGPRGGDEINRIEASANYGWPIATHGIDYSGASISPYRSRPGMVDPLLTWTPSIAPAGLAIYRGNAFPDWDGDLLVAALAARELRRVELEGQTIVGQHAMLGELGERLRDVRVGPDGLIYVLTDSADGRLLRFRPAD